MEAVVYWVDQYTVTWRPVQQQNHWWSQWNVKMFVCSVIQYICIDFVCTLDVITTHDMWLHFMSGDNLIHICIAVVCTAACDEWWQPRSQRLLADIIIVDCQPRYWSHSLQRRTTSSSSQHWRFVRLLPCLCFYIFCLSLHGLILTSMYRALSS